ncbi:hypothetical protein Bca52824_023499 [Brassica carinata]|uniref:Uncharacterized protein n=1 Tax=Brassica carinata TaxID=52824 RepID=A0A8X7VIN3_BRACI|nr:hypothetical protein Bca52824_023499 [Brassica carinata]
MQDLADLKVGRCSATIKVRILRLWEARNVKKSGEGVNMILAKVILFSLHPLKPEDMPKIKARQTSYFEEERKGEQAEYY